MSLKFKRHAFAASLAAGCAVLGAASPCFAQATEYCADLALPNPVYGNGGSALTADLGKVAAALRSLPSPITIFYSDAVGACPQFTNFATANAVVKDDFHYWEASGTRKDCKAPAVTGQKTDFAHMGNPASACSAVTPTADVKDFIAPVQTINILTQKDSTEQSISAEALYFVYGFGDTGQAEPWSHEAYIVKRSGTSFASLLVAAAIGIPGSGFKGATTSTDNAGVITAIDSFKDVTKNAIGYASGSAADKDASAATGPKVKTLAFQAKGQTCGFWPDSTATKLDKINVRNGQYALWTPGHFFARVDGANKIVKQEVSDLIHWYDGTLVPPAGLDVVGLTIDSGDIPLCAMQVTREGLYGAISSQPAPKETGPCTHFFEKRATKTTTGTACPGGADAECASVTGEPKCRFGYCEAY